MKILTFNIRCDLGLTGLKRFEHRKQLILEAIERERPLVIGFQEVVPYVYHWLGRMLPDYLIVGCGRSRRLSGERVCIALRKDELELIKLETFWLSNSPDVPGSRFFPQSPMPRICTHVHVQHIKSKKTFHVYNTHLDFLIPKARELGLALLAERIKAQRAGRDEPVALIGDFNALPGSPELAPIRAIPWLLDATATLNHSYHSFGRLSRKGRAKKLDYVFLSPEFSIGRAYPLDEEKDGIFLSDHYPLAVECTLP